MARLAWLLGHNPRDAFTDLRPRRSPWQYACSVAYRLTGELVWQAYGRHQADL